MSTFTEGDARKVIVLVSDDGGLTWHPPDDSASIYTEADAIKIIRLGSADSGVTWTPDG